MLRAATSSKETSLSCSLELDGKYIGEVEIDNRIFTFGEVTKINENKYQIVPVSEKYRNRFSNNEKNEIGKNTVIATIDGEKYEGPVIIIDNKKVSISDTRIVPDSIDYNIEIGLKKLKVTNEIKLKFPEKDVKNSKGKIQAEQISHFSLFSVPSINENNSPNEDVRRDIDKRHEEYLESLDKMHKKERKEFKEGRNVSSNTAFFGSVDTLSINLDLLVEALKSNKEIHKP